MSLGHYAVANRLLRRAVHSSRFWVDTTVPSTFSVPDRAALLLCKQTKTSRFSSQEPGQYVQERGATKTARDINGVRKRRGAGGESAQQTSPRFRRTSENLEIVSNVLVMFDGLPSEGPREYTIIMK
jgi:hypothetical protein